MKKDGRIWMGVVVDEEYWKAVKEMPKGEKYRHYLCGGEPMYSLFIRKNMVKGYPKIYNKWLWKK